VLKKKAEGGVAPTNTKRIDNQSQTTAPLLIARAIQFKCSIGMAPLSKFYI